MENLITSEIFDRMIKVADLRNSKELAVFLSVPTSTLSTWKNKTSIPLNVVMEFANRVNCDLNWLLLGESKEKKLDTSERMLLTAFADLTDSEKMQAVTFIGNLANGVAPVQAGQTLSHSTTGDVAGRDLIKNRD